MQLRTYTGLWSVEKRLYKLYDVNLPYPVSIKQVGIFIGAFVPWIALMALLGVPFGPPFGHIIWLAPPIALAWWGNKPVAEGKNLPDYVQAQAGFLLGPRHYAAMAPVPAEGARHVISGTVWQLPERADNNTETNREV